ncbi:MAG TPA: hypothetical protein VH396_09520, partial [Chitinophagaceae bacterium]
MFAFISVALLLSVFGFSQTKNDDSIILYIHNTYLDNNDFVKEISLDYDLYYPAYRPVSERIKLKRNTPI